MVIIDKRTDRRIAEKFRSRCTRPAVVGSFIFNYRPNVREERSRQRSDINPPRYVVADY